MYERWSSFHFLGMLAVSWPERERNANATNQNTFGTNLSISCSVRRAPDRQLISLNGMSDPFASFSFDDGKHLEMEKCEQDPRWHMDARTMILGHASKCMFGGTTRRVLPPIFQRLLPHAQLISTRASEAAVGSEKSGLGASPSRLIRGRVPHTLFTRLYYSLDHARCRKDLHVVGE